MMKGFRFLCCGLLEQQMILCSIFHRFPCEFFVIKVKKKVFKVFVVAWRMKEIITRHKLAGSVWQSEATLGKKKFSSNYK